MSPRAAYRLEALSFADVYDYVSGTADWLAHNLFIEGRAADRATAARLARDDIVTCAAHDRAAANGSRARPTRSRSSLRREVSCSGRRCASALDDASDQPAERLMEHGPSAVRSDVPAPTLAKRIADRELQTVIVTTPEGWLIGIARREDVERAEPR